MKYLMMIFALGVSDNRPECDECEVPCFTMDYRHDLSTSDLSSFNIRRLLFSNDQQSKRWAAENLFPEWPTDERMI